MKLSLFLLVVCLQAGASGWGQSTINLQVKNKPITEVLKSVRKQAKMQFILVDPELKGSKPVTISMENATLKEALDKIFDNQPYTYTITDNVIVVQKRTASFVDPIHSNSSDKKIDVRGKVLNEEGEPVAAASVRVKGTKDGTTTNDRGEFTIAADETATLIISAINIETVELRLNGRSSVTVFTKMQISPMAEVVSKGYYKEKKLTSVGNVGKVSSEEIQRQPVGNPLMALQGRVAGLDVSQASGMPGKAITLRVRGINSIASGLNPLYVIDGVPQFNGVGTANAQIDNPLLSRTGGVANNQFNSLNPADIESIEVLKDADATAIYGSRGANGVILVTTKKGNFRGKELRGNITATYGTSKITNAYNLLNTQQYITMRKEAYRNDGITNYPANAYDINGTWDTTRYTNWQDELIGKSAKYYDLQSSISGNSNSISYLFGFGYHRETTVYPGEFFDERKSLHLNLSHRPAGSKFSATTSILYSLNKNELPLTDLTGLASSLPPNAPSIYSEDGSLNWEKGTWSNPFAQLNRLGKTNNDFLNANLELSYKLLAGLSVKLTAGYNATNHQQKNIIYRAAFNPTSVNDESSIDFGNTKLRNWSVEPQIDYKQKFGLFNFQALIGSSLTQQRFNYDAIRGVGFTTDELIENVTAANRATVIGSQSTLYKYAAAYSRVYFDYDEKYLINLTGRRDGSSRFGDGKKFSNFYAIGAGWIFSKEKFVTDNISFLSFGKIRASYGITGNDQIGDYQYLETFMPNTEAQLGLTYYGFVTIRPTRLVNPTYSWERLSKMEAGLEMGFLQDKIFASISYFTNKTSNQLLQYRLPIITGFPSVISNLPATVSNKGLEIELSATIIKKSKFSWRMAGNISFLRNELQQFDNLENSSYAANYVVGKSLSVVKRYEYVGIDPNTGLYTFNDIDGNSTVNSLDMIVPVDLTRDFFGGLSNSVTVGKLAVDFNFQFVEQKLGRGYTSNLGVPGSMRNQPILVLNRWQKPGDNASIQRFTTSSTTFSRYNLSTGGIEDVSFIRLKNVQLSYELLSNIRNLSSLVIFVQSQNLLTITKYQGLDPESGSLLPPMKTFVAGVRIGF